MKIEIKGRKKDQERQKGRREKYKKVKKINNKRIWSKKVLETDKQKEKQVYIK